MKQVTIFRSDDYEDYDDMELIINTFFSERKDIMTRYEIYTSSVNGELIVMIFHQEI